MKKPTGSVRFRFYKQKTEPNRNRQKTKNNRAKPKKPSQNRKKPSQNRFEPVFALKKPNRTETGRFDPVSVFFFKKKSVWLFFFIKTKPNRINMYVTHLNKYHLHSFNIIIKQIFISILPNAFKNLNKRFCFLFIFCKKLNVLRGVILTIIFIEKSK